MSNSRRYFLKSSGLVMASFAAAPRFLIRTAAAQSVHPAGADRPILVAIFQRGAADGLAMVAPFGDRNYYSLRQQVAVPAPKRGTADGAIDLDGFFGLNPALASLKAPYDAGHLAIVHATGSPDSTRSHFDAQDYMEAGAPGNKSARDGWLNRYLQANPDPRESAFRAVGFSPKMPRSLLGRAPALAMEKIEEFAIQGGAGRDSGALQAEFAAMWGSNGTFDAIKMLKSANPRQYSPENGANYAGKLGQTLFEVAQLIKANIGLEVVFAEIGGWDTHANQANQLNTRLKEFGDAIGAFHRDMGDRMRNIVLVTMTEFGRTLKQNGSGGTDHGHGSALFVMGGPVKGGKVYGKWPGLDTEQLFEKRDLAITTDFRDVLGEIVTRHMGVATTNAIFPGYRPQQTLGLL